jgi:hypothetical protein
LRQPEAACRALCAFMRLPFCADMSTPYTAANLATFEPAAVGGLGASDPKLRANSGINAAMADAWMTACVPRRLSPFAAHIALQLGYDLPAWKEPVLRPDAPAAVRRLNSATGGVPVIFMPSLGGSITHAASLATCVEEPAFGLLITRELAQLSLSDRAAALALALQSLGLPRRVMLAATDDFGARIGHALLGLLGANVMPSLVLLDSALAGPLDAGLSPDDRALWELACEAAVLSGASPPDRAQLMRALGACIDADERLELITAACKPDNMSRQSWEELSMDVVRCVVASLATATDVRGGHGRRALLVVSHAGHAARLAQLNGSVWAGELSIAQLDVASLHAPGAAKAAAAALHAHARGQV